MGDLISGGAYNRMYLLLLLLLLLLFLFTEGLISRGERL